MSAGRPAGNRPLTTIVKLSDETHRLMYRCKDPPETHDETILKALREYAKKRV